MRTKWINASCIDHYLTKPCWNFVPIICPTRHYTAWRIRVNNYPVLLESGRTDCSTSSPTQIQNLNKGKTRNQSNPSIHSNVNALKSSGRYGAYLWMICPRLFWCCSQTYQQHRPRHTLNLETEISLESLSQGVVQVLLWVRYRTDREEYSNRTTINTNEYIVILTVPGYWQ